MKTVDIEKSLLSIVLPCYNEEAVLPETIKRMTAFCSEVDMDVELVFVNDGSADNTLPLLREFAQADPRVKVISFARNFGHQVAVSAGVDAASGDAVVLIDADLQDPPEVIHQMIAKWREGFDVVYGTRASRSGESAFKLATAKIFYRVLNYLSTVPIPMDTGDFRLMDKKVVSVLRAMPEKDRFVRGMVSWIGFNQCSLPYQRSERFAGESKYPLRKMIRFAFDGILSFSSKPLQLSVFLGFFSSALAILMMLYALIQRIFTAHWVEGWTALMVAVLFLGGVQLLCVGIMGEYIGRIYNESKNRPLYIVKEKWGFDSSSTSAEESTEHSRPTAG